MPAFREPALPRGYAPGPSSYRFVPYHHATPPKTTPGPLKAYEPTRNCSCMSGWSGVLSGIFPCICTNTRPQAQAYYDPLVHTNPLPLPPQTSRQRRESASTSFLQRIFRSGSKPGSNRAQPVEAARKPSSNAYPPSRPDARYTAHAQLPTPGVPSPIAPHKRRDSTPGHVHASSARRSTQTPMPQHRPLPVDSNNAPKSWYIPRASQQPPQPSPHPPVRSAALYTPQVAPAILPEDPRPSRRPHTPIPARHERRKAPSRTRTKPTPPEMQQYQASDGYVSPYSPASAIPEEPIYFANHSHHHLKWLAPECRLPRPFVFKGRHFWSVTQAVAWLKARAIGDKAMAREIKNLDASLSKREFERRAANLSNAICAPHGWLQGLAGVYKSVALAAFRSDEGGVRSLLLVETGHRDLIWDAPDWDWGRGGNRYGRVLMDVRSQLRQEVHSGAHREMEYRLPPTTTHRVIPATPRLHHTPQTHTVYPYSGYSDLRQRRSRSGRHHVQFNATPMVHII